MTWCVWMAHSVNCITNHLSLLQYSNKDSHAGSLEDSQLEMEEDECLEGEAEGEETEDEWGDAEVMKELMIKLTGASISKEDQLSCWDVDEGDSLEEDLLDNEDGL